MFSPEGGGDAEQHEEHSQAGMPPCPSFPFPSQAREESDQEIKELFRESLLEGNSQEEVLQSLATAFDKDIGALRALLREELQTEEGTLELPPGLPEPMGTFRPQGLGASPSGVPGNLTPNQSRMNVTGSPTSLNPFKLAPANQTLRAGATATSNFVAPGQLNITSALFTKTPFQSDPLFNTTAALLPGVFKTGALPSVPGQAVEQVYAEKVLHALKG